MPQDEFEFLLDRCRDRLSKISLRVPELENGPPQIAPALALEPLRPAREPTAPLPPVPQEAPPPVPPERTPPPIEPPPTSAIIPAPRQEGDLIAPTPAGSAAPSSGTAPAEASTAAASGRRSSALAVGAAAAAVAAGALGVWLQSHPSDLALEIDRADAVVVRPDKGDILVAQGKELVDLNLDGKALRHLPLDAPVDTLHWDRGTLWTSDGRTPTVVAHPDDIGPDTVYTLNHVPSALFVRDKYLWTAEKGASSIRQFLISRSILGAMLQPIDRYELTGLSPETISIDAAGDLWLVDSVTRKLYHLRLDGGMFKTVAAAPLSPFVGPAGRIRGLNVDGDSVWLLAVTGKTDILRRIALNRFDWAQQ